MRGSEGAGNAGRRGAVHARPEPVSHGIRKRLSQLENLKASSGVFVKGRHQPPNTPASHSFARLFECLSILGRAHFVCVFILF